MQSIAYEHLNRIRRYAQVVLLTLYRKQTTGQREFHKSIQGCRCFPLSKQTYGGTEAKALVGEIG